MRPARFLLLSVLVGMTAHGQTVGSPPTRRDSLLGHLIGDWVMTGTARGKPVEYTLAARWTLQDNYVELHMLDVARPPAYEARLIIGVAGTPGQLIAHWIDNFGAEYSVPTATGAIRGDTLTLDFPYPDRPFHDVFVFDRATKRWRFVLDAADGRGGWTRFAEYEVKPRS